MRGKLVVFEGLDGVGKTSAIRSVIDQLTPSYDVAFLSEYSNPNSENIRALLNNPSFSCSTLTEAYLFYASRICLVRDQLIPALDAGKIVILDRFYHSTLAYQGASPDVRAVHRLSKPELVEPDLVLLIDMDYDLIANRLSERPEGRDRIEQRDHTYHRTVQARYHEFASEDDSFRIVNANQSKEGVAAACVKHIRGILR